MRRALTAMALVFGLLPGPAGAAEFRVAGDAAVVLYDAPSVKARKLYIVNKGYPLEVVVQVEGWTKVRDAAGALSWAEARTLDKTRGALVKAATATVRQQPADDAPAVIEIQRDVLLEVLEGAAGGWIHVKHRDGAAGYVRVADVWGG